MRTQLEEFQSPESRLLVHLPFEFNDSAAGAGASEKASRKRKLELKSALEQLCFGTQICTLAHICTWFVSYSRVKSIMLLLRVLVCASLILMFYLKVGEEISQ